MLDEYCHTVLEDPVPACCGTCSRVYFSSEEECISSKCEVCK